VAAFLRFSEMNIFSPLHSCMTHARPLYSNICTPCRAGCWRQTHHSAGFRKSQLIAASGPGSRSTLSAPCQAYVISWHCYRTCSVQTLSSLVTKNCWMIPRQRPHAKLSRNTPQEKSAEQTQSGRRNGIRPFYLNSGISQCI